MPFRISKRKGPAAGLALIGVALLLVGFSVTVKASGAASFLAAIGVLVGVTGAAAALDTTAGSRILRRAFAHGTRPPHEKEPTECHVPASGVLTDLQGTTARRHHPLGETSLLVTRLRRPPEGTPVMQILASQISRRHASISYREGSYWIEDHDSVNGTWVNDRCLHGLQRLKVGDVVRFYTFEFEFQAAPARRARGARGGVRSADTEVM